MTSFLRNLFTITGQSDNDFVGNDIEVGNQKLRVQKIIAEGGFAFVYETIDLSTRKEYALKRLLSSDAESARMILKEINILKKLSGHPNIINFISAASIQQGGVGQSEFLILTELCKGGQLVDVLRSQTSPLCTEVILQLFYQTCCAVAHLHSQEPAVIHRDLKVENLLICRRNTLKLCDFGSCTTEQHAPDMSWSAAQRANVEDEMAKNTTPMYRAPEMLDLYQNLPIGPPSDVWALGCLLYLFCFNHHPFEDSAKLAIINGNYQIPNGASANPRVSSLLPMVRMCLSVDPRERPPVAVLCAQIQEFASARGFNDLDGALHLEGLPVPLLQSPTSDAVFLQASTPPVRSPLPPRRPATAAVPASSPLPAPSQNGHQAPASSAPGAGGMLSALRGGAGSLVNNLRTASTRVMETVSSGLQNMASGELDLSYLTSRILVMSFPAEGLETTFRNHIDDVKAFLDAHHPHAYAIYNLSQRRYRSIKFENRVSECGFDPKVAPPLSSILSVCRNMHLWLRTAPKNVCVVHCVDGRAASALITCAMLCYCRFVLDHTMALELFAKRRSDPQLSASQCRYLDYVIGLVGGLPPAVSKPFVPHRHPVLLTACCISPVPLFNRLKNGCKPFAEVFLGTEKILSTVSDYDSMLSFSTEDDRVVLPLNISVCGDVTISVYHARTTIGGKVHGKLTSLKILQVQFHSGYIRQHDTFMFFDRNELDQVENSEDKLSGQLRLTLELMVSPQEKPRAADCEVPMWEDEVNWQSLRLKPDILFFESTEMMQVSEELAMQPNKGSKQEAVLCEPETGPSTQVHGNSSFFNTLGWEDIPCEQTAQPEYDQTSPLTPPDAFLSSTVSFENASKVEVDSTRVANLLGLSFDESPIPPPAVQSEALTNKIFNLFDELPEEENNAFELKKAQDPFAHFESAPKGCAAPLQEAQDPFADFEYAPKGSAAPLQEAQDPFSHFESAPKIRAASIQDAQDPFAHLESTSKSSTAPVQEAGDLFACFDSPPVQSEKIGGSDFRHTFDPFSSSDNDSSNLLDFTSAKQPSASTKSASSNGKISPPQRPSDPFADLFSQIGVSGAKPSMEQQRKTSEQKVSAASYGAKLPPMGNNYRPYTNSASPQHKPVTPEKSAFTPNYNVGGIFNPAPPKQQAPPMSNVKHAFEEFGFGTSSGTSGGNNSKSAPKTVNELRRAAKAANRDAPLDPDQLRVEAWTEGKERNIRSLLCSMHKLIWEGCRWREVSMAEVISADQVKKTYRKACLAVHPDKWPGTPYERLAKYIFMELNDAWAEFEEKGCQNLY